MFKVQLPDTRKCRLPKSQTKKIVESRLTMDDVGMKLNPSDGILAVVDPAVRFPVRVVGSDVLHADSIIAFGDEMHSQK